MRIAQDAIPGQIIPMWFKPIKTGTYEVVCGQLCGLGHYGMKGMLVVDTPDDYQAWLKERIELSGNQSAPPPLPRPPGEPRSARPRHRRASRRSENSQPGRRIRKRTGFAPDHHEPDAHARRRNQSLSCASLCLVHRGGDASSHLQRRNGDEQRSRPRRARLADDFRLQHVFLSRSRNGSAEFSSSTPIVSSHRPSDSSPSSWPSGSPFRKSSAG